MLPASIHRLVRLTAGSLVIGLLLSPAACRPASAQDVRLPSATALRATLLADRPPSPSPIALRAVADDRWLGYDKLQHFTFSFLATLSGRYVLVDKAGVTAEAALPIAAGGTAILGLSKEVYDGRRGRRSDFSARDLVADAAGIAAAVVVILL